MTPEIKLPKWLQPRDAEKITAALKPLDHDASALDVALALAGAGYSIAAGTMTRHRDRDQPEPLPLRGGVMPLTMFHAATKDTAKLLDLFNHYPDREPLFSVERPIGTRRWLWLNRAAGAVREHSRMESTAARVG